MKGCAHRHLEAVLSTHLPLTAFMLLPRGTRPWDGIDSISHAFRNLAWIQMVTMAHPGLSSISLISFKVPNNSQVLIFSFATLKLYNTVLNIAQSCPTLYDPMDCSPPGSCVHWILQARILGWVAMPSTRGCSQPRDETQGSCIAGRFFSSWATREAHRNKLSFVKVIFCDWSNLPRFIYADIQTSLPVKVSVVLCTGL